VGRRGREDSCERNVRVVGERAVRVRAVDHRPAGPLPGHRPVKVQTVQNPPGAQRTRLPDVQDVAARYSSDSGEQQDQYRHAKPPGADRRAQFRHLPYAEGRSGHPDEQPAETDGRQPQAGPGDIVAEQHCHGEKASKRQQIQMLDSPRATPVEQPEDKAGRPRYGHEQRMQREHAADDRRGKPAAPLRHEPMTNWHDHGQHH
jgi:hypothetical protein